MSVRAKCPLNGKWALMAKNTRVGQRPRQRRTDDEKRRIVEETLAHGASVSVVARRHDVNANQVFTWRRQYRRGELGGGAALVPVGVVGAGGIVSAISDLTKPQAFARAVGVRIRSLASKPSFISSASRLRVASLPAIFFMGKFPFRLWFRPAKALTIEELPSSFFQQV